MKGMRMLPMFSRESDEWETPEGLFRQLDAVHQFTLDPCSTDQNHKCAKWFTKLDDGLGQDWSGERVWMNPPYSEVSHWLWKAWDSVRGGACPLVVALVPSRTDTAWWHDIIAANRISYSFVRGRIRFVQPNGATGEPAPFPSVLITFRGDGPQKATPTIQGDETDG